MDKKLYLHTTSRKSTQRAQRGLKGHKGHKGHSGGTRGTQSERAPIEEAAGMETQTRDTGSLVIMGK